MLWIVGFGQPKAQGHQVSIVPAEEFSEVRLFLLPLN